MLLNVKLSKHVAQAPEHKDLHKYCSVAIQHVQVDYPATLLPSYPATLLPSYSATLLPCYPATPLPC